MVASCGRRYQKSLDSFLLTSLCSRSSFIFWAMQKGHRRPLALALKQSCMKELRSELKHDHYNTSIDWITDAKAKLKQSLRYAIILHLNNQSQRRLFPGANLQHQKLDSCGVIKCLYCLWVYLCLLLFRISASWPIAFSLEMFWHFHLGMSARLHFHLSLILPSILVISSLFLFLRSTDRSW